MQEQHEFKQMISFGEEKNSCMKCGKTLEAHLPKRIPIYIYFNGKLWKFNDWKNAREHGFYLY